jgi:hypothetical protein
LATGKAIRADDGSGLNIGTVTFTEDAVTKHAQQIVLVDASTPTQKAGVDASGNVKVIAAANSGIDIGDVTINNAGGASAVTIQDGGNSITVDGTVTATLSGSINNTGFNATPATSGGTSAYHAVAAATNNAASVKGTAGQVYGWSIYNNAGYPVYVKLYNKATAPAPASDNALLIKVIGVQAGTHVSFSNSCGISGFTNGIGIAAVKDITDTGNTSLVLSDCLIEIDYK